MDTVQRLSDRLQCMSDNGDFGSMLEEYPEKARALEKERDELAAQVDVMREALLAQRELDYTESGSVLSYKIEECERLQELALSITGPDALREIQARTLDDAASEFDVRSEKAASSMRLIVQSISVELRDMAAAIRKGE